MLRHRLTLIILGSLALSGCGEGNPTPLASPELLEMGADQVIFLMVNHITVNGVREGRVEADTAYLYQDSSVVHLRNARLVLYDERGLERARVTARSGRLDNNTKELLAREDVVLIIAEGDRRVESPELNYDPNGERIWSDSATVLYEPGRVTRGRSFESDLHFRNARVVNGSMIGTGGVRF